MAARDVMRAVPKHSGDDLLRGELAENFLARR